MDALVLTKAGLDLPVWTIVGVPAAVGAAAWLVHRLQFRKAPVAAWARTS
jgi:phenylalanine-4-hydroxylase